MKQISEVGGGIEVNQSPTGRKAKNLNVIGRRYMLPSNRSFDADARTGKAPQAGRGGIRLAAPCRCVPVNSNVMWQSMRRPAFPLFGPLADSRKRQSALEEQLRQLDAKTESEEHARVGELIQLEEDFRASFSGFLKERAAQRRSVSTKGLLQLVALSILVFIAIGVKRNFFG